LLQKSNTKNENPPRARIAAGVPCVLAIAGSDSGGCAGIQADLRALAAFGVHGLSAITAITAQTSERVSSTRNVPADMVAAQIAAAFAGFDVAAVKIGMLGNANNVRAVAAELRRRHPRYVVLDPVLASSSGTALLAANALARLRIDLFPLVDLLTPNLPEAEILLGRRLRTRSDRHAAARDLLATGVRAVLLKGGHATGPVVTDVLATRDGVREFRHARRRVDARGTGCTLAASIAAGLALGLPLLGAVAAAQRAVQAALRAAYRPSGARRRVLGMRTRVPKL
jgi:hydroxymethylpyrimidine/phosphomethylpyrimidine kinase